MIVVSDTKPPNYLVLISAVEVLPRLLEEVYAPTAVLREMADPRAPEAVRHWSHSPPKLLKIADPPEIGTGPIEVKIWLVPSFHRPIFRRRKTGQRGKPHTSGCAVN